MPFLRMVFPWFLRRYLEYPSLSHVVLWQKTFGNCFEHLQSIIHAALLFPVQGPWIIDLVTTWCKSGCKFASSISANKNLSYSSVVLGLALSSSLEAVHFQMPKRLRNLLAVILACSCQAEPRLLWDDYFEALSDDYQHQMQLDSTERRVLFRTLLDVHHHEVSNGTSLTAFPELPQLKKS